MAAAAFKSPELALDQTEARSLSEGIIAVQSFYNFSPSAEVIAWCNLAAIVAGVYGPRIVMIHGRKKEEREKDKQKTRPVASVSAIKPQLDGVPETIFHHAPTD